MADNITKRTGSWNWQRPRDEGIWRFGAAWFKPLVAAAPYLTLLILLLSFLYIERSFTVAQGTLFELPVGGAQDALNASLIAVVMPMPNGNLLVFFDDARYVVSEYDGLDAFRERLTQRIARGGERTLMLLADKRVSAGDLMQLMATARESGVKQIQIAEQRERK